MRFNRIEIPETETGKWGLKPINISGLNGVVVFIGKNGSGKSRILNVLKNNLLVNVKVENLISSDIEFVPQYLLDIIKLSNENIEWIKSLDIKERARQLNGFLAASASRDPNNRSRQRWSTGLQTMHAKYVRTIEHGQVSALRKKFDSSSSTDFNRLIEKAVEEHETYHEITSVYESGLTYLSKLPHQLAVDQINDALGKAKFDESLSYKRYCLLNDMLEIFLEKKLTWEFNSKTPNLDVDGVDVRYFGTWKLDGLEFDYGRLSDGEKTLFAYAMLFFLLEVNSDLSIKESIIIIDEPELHLHASSEIKLFEKIKGLIVEKGQLIIATHSLSILSHLNYDEVFLVKDGEIQRPNRYKLADSMSELVSDKITKLSDFLTSLSTWTYVNFMSECFADPEVIEFANANDPQVIAFKDIVKEKSSRATKMLLDFGAGKGRMLRDLKGDSEFFKNVQYSALEPEEEFHKELEQLGAKVYSDLKDIPKEQFDFVLLCNVLHEIEPVHWKDALNAVINSLSDDGYLVIVEAKTLTKGEKIGQVGYLLLDVEEIKTLFSVNEIADLSVTSNDRITCVGIAKRDLKQVADQSILDTLTALEINTLNKIKEIRKQEISEKDAADVGRKSAFYSQLHINAKLAKDFMAGVRKN